MNIDELIAEHRQAAWQRGVCPSEYLYLGRKQRVELWEKVIRETPMSFPIIPEENPDYDMLYYDMKIIFCNRQNWLKFH